MPAIQSTYTATHAAAFEGMVADLGPSTVVSRTVETAAIGFGKAVSQGTADRGIVAAASAATKFLGITVRDQAVDPASPDQYRIGDTAGVLTIGAVWAKAYEAVAAGDPVYFVTATGLLGKTSTDSTLVANARWDSAAAADGLAIIRLK
jgi:hypothetical protein